MSRNKIPYAIIILLCGMITLHHSVLNHISSNIIFENVKTYQTELNINQNNEISFTYFPLNKEIILANIEDEKAPLSNISFTNTNQIKENVNKIINNSDNIKEEYLIEEREEHKEVFVEVDDDVWATTSVNVRVEPNKDSERVGSLKEGDKVHRIGEGENGWSKIIYNGDEFYINSKYLSITEIIPTPQIIPENTSSVISSLISAESETISSSLLNTCNDYISKLPTNVQDFLINNGVHIYITDTNLSNRFFNGQYKHVQGCTVYDSKTIYLSNSNNYIKNAVIHEVGHIVDYLSGWKSSSEEFVRIFEEERDSFIEIGKADDNNTSSSSEYFAECFNQTILYPESCSSHSPSSYTYIINILSNL